MIALIERLRAWLLLRYAAASLGALGCDMAAFLALLRLGAAAAPASAAGYALGIAIHWWLSSRKVFADSVAPSGPARRRQKAMFVASALIGLALTTAIVGVGGTLGLDPRAAKLVAVGMSFAVTWGLRQRIVFA